VIGQDGHGREADWQAALVHVAKGLSETRFKYDPSQIGALASPHSTLEEMALLAKLIRAMGSDNSDHRLRQEDFSADGKRAGAPWLGMKGAGLGHEDRGILDGADLGE